MPHSVVVCHELDKSKLYDNLYSYFCSAHCGGTRLFSHCGQVQHYRQAQPAVIAHDDSAAWRRHNLPGWRVGVERVLRV